jgi:ABC-type phosphate transport system substrate-binding protein
MSAHSRILPIALVLLGEAAAAANAEPLVVIVNPESGVTQLTRAQVTDLFMGRQKRLGPGLVALPMEQMVPATRSRFYLLLVNLPVPQIRAYWARLYFSGQAQPPRQAETAEELIQMVAANRGAIGFIEASKLDKRVKGVLRLDDTGFREP